MAFYYIHFDSNLTRRPTSRIESLKGRTYYIALAPHAANEMTGIRKRHFEDILIRRQKRMQMTMAQSDAWRPFCIAEQN